MSANLPRSISVTLPVRVLRVSYPGPFAQVDEEHFRRDFYIDYDPESGTLTTSTQSLPHQDFCGDFEIADRTAHTAFAIAAATLPYERDAESDDALRDAIDSIFDPVKDAG